MAGNQWDETSGELRPHKRPDGWPTRAATEYWSAAERAIQDAANVVERSGGSPALTDAVMLLAKARDRVADHMEGQRE